MKKLSFLALAAFANVAAMAQDAKVDVNLKGDGGGSNYWMWIIGAIVLVVLLIVLLSGRGGGDRVVKETTIVRD